MNNKTRKRPVVSTLSVPAQSALPYLDVSSVCGAQVGDCAPVDRYHVDRGNQGVGQLLVPVLQPLDKLGDLQAVLAFFAFVDSLVRGAIVGRALEKETKGMNKTEPFWHLPRMKAHSESSSRECACCCVYVHFESKL